ncbi:MAG TPA: methyltransferase domain-containing protein [Pseudonocardiaceae bacterium]|jgi:SAM-dependent methyltransferase|nr:methyltransferase domain-containing protein [Pseudonocardiaceae bacterium]
MTADTPPPSGATEQVQQVRDRYATAARRLAAVTEYRQLSEQARAPHYDTEPTADLPLTASLGCGNPIAVAELHADETVLDLGSGAGLDVLLSARRVGPAGRAIGLDMTGEMLDLARRHAADGHVTNVEFLRGRIEDIPLPDGSVWTW